MKQLFPAWLFLLLSLQAQAQLGISVSSDYNLMPGWQAVVENYISHKHTPFMKYGTSATIDYAVLSGHDKWKFHPAIHATLATLGLYPHYFKAYGMGIQCNLSFQLLSFNSHQEAASFPSRLLLMISPGADAVLLQYEHPAGTGEPSIAIIEKNASLAPNGGLALTIELGLSDFLTVAPFCSVRYYPNVQWEGFTAIVSNGQLSGKFDRTAWRQFSLGLRIGLDIRRHSTGSHLFH